MPELIDTVAIKFKPSMTMDNVSELYDELKKSLEHTPKKVVFECAVNEEIDFITLQTLAAYYKHRKAEGVKLAWDNPSIALFSKAVELGVDDALGL